jgi:NtrC-family two-component system response regulator AlgB
MLADGSELGLSDLPERLVRAGSLSPSLTADQPAEVGGRISLEQLEIEHIRRVLATSASRDEAARILGIDPSTLYRKRKQYGL